MQTSTGIIDYSKCCMEGEIRNHEFSKEEVERGLRNSLKREDDAISEVEDFGLKVC
jgi:hypothetical protein